MIASMLVNRRWAGRLRMFTSVLTDYLRLVVSEFTRFEPTFGGFSWVRKRVVYHD